MPAPTIAEQLRTQSLADRAHVLRLLLAQLRADASLSIPSRSLRGEICLRLKPVEREIGALEELLKHSNKVTKNSRARECET